MHLLFVIVFGGNERLSPTHSHSVGVSKIMASLFLNSYSEFSIWTLRMSLVLAHFEDYISSLLIVLQADLELITF